MARFGFGQEMRQAQRQEMLLQPRMLQAIEILALPTQDLDAYLRNAAEENAALELHEPSLGVDFGIPTPRERVRSKDATARHSAMLEAQPARTRSVAEQVEEELATADLDPATLAWVRCLIGCLDSDGFLAPNDDELLALARDRGLQGDANDLARAIAALQQLEPRGVGARNATEALLLQLDPSDPDYRDLARLIEDFLGELAKNKLPAVAKAMGLDVDSLRELIARLAELSARPAADLDRAAAPPIVPDVLVRAGENGWEIALDDSRASTVTLDESVRELARDRELDRKLREHLRGQVERARWIVDAVSQRRATLLRVATAVFHHQRPYLDHGPGHLVPLRMTDVASEIGLHVSTISRAVAGKYAETPWGIEPLRRFFQASSGHDPDSARDDVRETVRALFAAEDPKRPLSDDEVVETLHKRGLELARRTITKYRQELGIPSSYRRRRHE
ncbi:MAG: RNA polymerase factor sigma-54 [Planctomycetes bacterium]|nr:RNA polymerase factor sigma-54 [Planctomycetota bacterium]